MSSPLGTASESQFRESAKAATLQWLGATRWLARVDRKPAFLSFLAYWSIFIVVAGPTGTRSSFLNWLHDASWQERVVQALVGVLVGMAATVIWAAARKAPDPGQMRLTFAGAPWWPWLCGAALSIGCAVQARLATDASHGILPALSALIGLLILAPITVTLVLRIRHTRSAFWIGLVLGILACAGRLLTLSDDAAAGAIFGLHVGEMTRAMVTVGLAISLGGMTAGFVADPRAAQRRPIGPIKVRAMTLGVLIRLLPSLGMFAMLIAFSDFGPAVIIFVISISLLVVTFSREFARRVSLIVAAWFVAVAIVAQVITQLWVWLHADGDDLIGHLASRITDLKDRFLDPQCTSPTPLDSQFQTCTSLRIMEGTGLFGDAKPLFHSPLARHLYAATSDYAITSIAGYLGMLVALLLVAALAATGLRLVLNSLRITGGHTGWPGEIRGLRVRLGLVAGLSLLIPTVWLGAAIFFPHIPVIGLRLPLTGLDVPYIAANGFSTLVYSALLGIGLLLVEPKASSLPTVEPASGGTSLPNEKRLSVAVHWATVALVAVMAVGILWIEFGTVSARLPREALLRDTAGRIMTADGEVFSEAYEPGIQAGKFDGANHLGQRVYPHPEMAVDLGFFLPGKTRNSAVGLEYLAAPLLTCGNLRTGILVGNMARCAPANVIATIDSKLQRAAAESAAAVADTYRTTGARVDVVIVDRLTGSVLALASSDSANKQMQALIQLDEPRTSWSPISMETAPHTPSTPAEESQLANHLARFALRHLNHDFPRCVGNKSDNPLWPYWDEQPAEEKRKNYSSKAQCKLDKQGLAIMRAWTEATAPGSTFKVVTALAAQESGVSLPLTPIPNPLFVVGDEPLRTPLHDRFEGTCNNGGSDTIPHMLARSCNTTAGWLGVSVGWRAMETAAGRLGFEPAEEDSTAVSEGGAIQAPSDGTGGGIAAIHYPTSTVGLAPICDPEKRAATKPDADCDSDQLSRTAIGQSHIKASVLDLVGITHTIVDSKDQSISPLRLISGTCRPDGGFKPVSALAARKTGIDDAHLDVIREGMRQAVSEGFGTAKKRLADDGVVMAKSGTAELGTGGVARWITGATEQYVFTARVTPVPPAIKGNPAMVVMEKILAQARNMAPQPNAHDPQRACDAADRDENSDRADEKSDRDVD